MTTWRTANNRNRRRSAYRAHLWRFFKAEAAAIEAALLAAGAIRNDAEGKSVVAKAMQHRYGAGK